MRRLVAAATVGSVLLLAAACGNINDSAGTASTPTVATTTAAPGPTVATVNNEICDSVKAINTEYAGKITAVFKQAAEAGLKGDEVAAQKAVGQLTALAGDWSGKIQPLAVRAEDPGLKQVLNDLVAGIKKLESGQASMNDMTKLVEQTNTALSKTCG
jgi:hypothetical protein